MDSATSMLAELRSKHEEALSRLQEWDEKIQALPPDAKTEEVEFLKGAFDKTNDEVRRWAESVERQQVIADARAKARPQNDDSSAKNESKHLSVKEPLTYRKNGPNQFFRDLRDAQAGNDDARARLNRHASEMRVEMRDITTTAGAGGEFVPPLWLQSQWVELLRAARPVADSVQRFDLPAGTNSINLPKLSGGGATAIQASENSGVQETDPTTTSVSAPVCTIAGQVDMSRQLFEFSNPGLDEVLFRDLARDYATKLDVQVISGPSGSGTARGMRFVSGIGTVTYTQATPTAATLWPKLADAISRVTAAFLSPDTIAMHPRRWASLLAALDSSGRPLVNAIAPYNGLASMDSGGQARANGAVGNIQGLNVILDPNIPTTVGSGTNEDVILVYDSKQLFLFEEGAPRSKVFEDVGSGTLTVRLQVYGFFAFLGTRYPAAISLITGTGLVPPTF